MKQRTASLVIFTLLSLIGLIATCKYVLKKIVLFQGEKHEAYVRLTLHQHYRSIKEKRTGVARPTKDGTVSFTEGFNFKLAPTQVDITSLAFHVFQATAGYGRDKLIGKCVLGSYMFARGKALIQWNTAIANPMEQCQQWHVLCD